MGLSLVNLLVLIIIIFCTIIMCLLQQTDTLLTRDDCPRSNYYYLTKIGDCKEMGAMECLRQCRETYDELLYGICDHQQDETVTFTREYEVSCLCCFKGSAYVGFERRRGDLPPEMVTSAELTPEMLSEDYWSTQKMIDEQLCPASGGKVYQVIGDCNILGEKLCVQTCRETYRDLHSAFCAAKYDEGLGASYHACHCCFPEPLSPGSELLPVLGSKIGGGEEQITDQPPPEETGGQGPTDGQPPQD